MKRRTLLSAMAVAPWWCAARSASAQHEHHVASAKDPNDRSAGARHSRVGIALSPTVAPDGSLWVVALNEQGRLFVQRSSDAGHLWSAPRLLDTGEDTIAAEGENRPKLRFGLGGRAVISYTRPLSKPYSGEIRMLRSDDGGATFSPPFTVHQDRQIITHRFESIAFDSTGALHTLWIDKRDLEASLRAGKADYAGAALYRNVSHDGGRTFGPDTKVADHTCECCRIALVSDGSDGLAAMWRHVFEGSVRDHAFVRIPPGGKEIGAVARSSFDGWKIDACPHHGPGLAPATDGGFHAVWFGVRDGEPGVRYGRLDANGKPRGAARVVPDAGAEHADVCSVGDDVAVVWRSFDGERTRYVAWISRDGGKNFVQQQLGATDVEADNPTLVRSDRAIVAVWRTSAEIHTARVLG